MDRLLLASSSPRRAELLARSGYAFDVVPADVDETPPPGAAPEAAALEIARRKAEAVSRPGVVLAADTIVVLEGGILGKPKDDDDARRMLHALSGRRHEVITAFCVRNGEREIARAVTTDVEFRVVPADEIDAYIATGEPRDKAGAYAIQGAGAFLVRSIEGSWTNVVGLPLVETIEALAEISDLRPFGKSP